MYTRTIVIFVGPQGVGKTTLAGLLRKSLSLKRACIVAADTANNLYIIFEKLIACVKGIYSRFYPDRELILRPDPRVLSKLWLLELVLGILGHLIALFKLTILSLFYDIVIEHEGFTFKFLANFMYSQFVYARRKLDSNTLLKRALSLTIFIVLHSLATVSRLMKFKILIVNMYAPYNRLIVRYRSRGSPIEPLHYVYFQQYIYSQIAKLIKMHSKILTGVTICKLYT